MNSGITCIVTKRVSGVIPVISGIGELSRRYAQFKRLFKDTKAYILFAEPIFVDHPSGTVISWFTEIQGTPISFSQMSFDAQNKVKDQLQQEIDEIWRIVATFDKIKKIKLVDMLESSLEIPAPDDIYLIGDWVVLTQWGFVSDQPNAQQGIIKTIVTDRPRYNLFIKILNTQGIPQAGLPIRLIYPREHIEGTTNDKGCIRIQKVPKDATVDVSITLANGYVYKKALICKKNQKEHSIEIPDSDTTQKAKPLLKEKSIAGSMLLHPFPDKKYTIDSINHESIVSKSDSFRLIGLLFLFLLLLILFLSRSCTPIYFPKLWSNSPYETMQPESSKGSGTGVGDNSGIGSNSGTSEGNTMQGGNSGVSNGSTGGLGNDTSKISTGDNSNLEKHDNEVLKDSTGVGHSNDDSFSEPVGISDSEAIDKHIEDIFDTNNLLIFILF
ncbi:MAG: hypothetical protein HQK77_01430 [Desulfobacterales bacterium]|nr:hypothetical protein [Desulfobacterales bacterium]